MKENRIYIDNSRFMEFIDEIATQLTELNFHEDTFDMDVERDELGFTEEAKDFYNERYDEVERMANSMMNLYSDDDKPTYKIYFKRLHRGTELVTNVTFVNADNIKEATLYAMKTFGDNLLEVVEK